MKRYNALILIILFTMMVSCSKTPNTSNTTPSSNTPSVSDNKTISESDKNNAPKDSNATEKKPVKEVMGLVRVDEMDPDIVIDLKYATPDNFTGRQIYTANVCALRKSTAEKLMKANEEFMKDGYRIKIWDGFRPIYVQQIFWDIVKDPRYVANPKYGSSHSTGCTVDVTLVGKDGLDVEMPTLFDDFSEKASRSYTGVSDEAKKNLAYLTKVMKRNGFTTINSEWWEFRDTEIGRYQQLDIKLEEFLD